MVSFTKEVHCTLTNQFFSLFHFLSLKNLFLPLLSSLLPALLAKEARKVHGEKRIFVSI
jgi:hypothetical protein